MFIACPHCHELVAARPQPRQSPELCPRCGGALQMPADTAAEIQVGPPTRSFATLLRGSDTVAAGPSPAQRDEPAVPTAAETETETESESSAAASPSSAAATTAPASAADSTDGAKPPADAVETAAEPQPPLSSNDGADATVETRRASDESKEPGSNVEPTVVPASAPARADVVSQPTGHVRGPSFIRASRTASVRSGAAKTQWWILGALSLLLVFQVLLADRARLAADPGWRPFLVSLCGVLRCSLPPWREPQAFVMLSRDVRPVAGVPGTLQAQATFRNDARWPQPWPILLLTLKDADGRTLGARALTPDEYLDASVDGAEIASGQSAQIGVRIREPSASVVAYSFDFR